MERTVYTGNKYLEVEGQLHLPEDYPGLEAVLATHGYLGEICGEISGNKLLLSGTVETHLVYQGKESLDQVPTYGMVWRGREGTVFNGEINLPELAADWDWQVRLLKTKLQPETDRTLKYQLELEVRLRAHQPAQVKFVEQIETDVPLKTEEEHLLVEEPLLQTYANREFSNTFPLSYPKPPLSRFISCQVFPVDSTATFAQDRVNIEGKLEVHLVYVTRTEDGQEGDLAIQRWTVENGGALPFQITVETPILQDPSVHYELGVESVEFFSAHPESCRVQARIGARVGLTKTRPVKAIIDVAAEKGLVDLQREIGSWIEVVEEAERSFVVEKMLTLPEQRPFLKNILQVLTAEPKLQWELAQDQLIVSGEILGTLLYQGEGADEEGAMIAAASWGLGGTEALTFGTVLDLPGVDEGMEARVVLHPQRIKVEQVDETTAKLAWEFKAEITVTQSREFLMVTDSALVVPEEGPKPSMLFYVVQPGDTLWGIARRYNTTMAALARTNQLTGDGQELVYGKKLLIPKEPLVN